MTEIDIMNDLECCSKDDCSNCSRGGEITNKCIDALMKDARSIIKKQQEAIEGFAKDYRKKEEEIAQLNTVCKLKFTLDELMKMVNEIMMEVYKQGHGWHDDEMCVTYDAGENWDGVFQAMRKFADAVDKAHIYAIAVHKDTDCPQFRKW